MIDHDHGQVNLLLVALGRSCKVERSVADGRDINFVANCATIAATLDRERLWWKGHCVEGIDEPVGVCDGFIGRSGKTEAVSLPSSADTKLFS